jgi:wyosine [tRNA(Phe)-imidazoG37] synthetase (radical SAM superfamily)
MYKHLFGPVPSRRLGMSLGVDLIPHKICSLNCIYCECGATTSLTMDRDEYVPVEEVKEELTHFFSHSPDPDFITFSGAGEPTLHSRMGEVLDFIKNIRPDVRVAVITNGTLFSDPNIRAELLKADVVLPSLDAATDAAFRKINRPLKQFPVSEYVDGLISFSKDFKGSVWLEVLIIPGYNDDPENVAALGEAIRSIAPEKIQLNTLDRPGVIEGLRPATREELDRIADAWGVENVEVVLPAIERHKSEGYRTDVESAIMETIIRRPCTLEDIQKILGLHINEVNKYLGTMEESGLIETSVQERGTFYQVKKS